METSVGIGDRLRKERERLGMNQTEFASVAGATRQSQSNYEIGVRSPDAEYLAAIAKRGADVQYILTGERKTIPRIGAVVEELQRRGMLPGQALERIQDEPGIYEIAEDEAELLQEYHEIPEEARETVRALLRYMRHEKPKSVRIRAPDPGAERLRRDATA